MDRENGQGEIIVYQAADGLTRVDVRFEGDTVWLTQAQLVDLYHSSKANISEHIKHILEEGELIEEATVRKFRTVQMEGSRQVSREISHYNLDMIIAIGYRVRTPVGTQFRRWATARSGDFPVLKDVGIAKNYLNEQELQVLNNLVSGYFDIAEIAAIEHRPMYMKDYIAQLDAVLTSGGRELLQNAGTISHKDAMEKARSEYRKYQEQTLSPVEEAYLETIKGLEKTAKKKSREKK